MPLQKIDRETLLHSCWEVIHRQGYHRTSISELAAAAGLGKAGLLHHFGSKEGLLQAVIDYALQQFRQYVLSVAGEDLPLDQRLEKLLRRQNRLAKYERRGCFFANTILELGREERFNIPLQAFYEEWQETVAGLFLEIMSPAEARLHAYRLLLEYEGAVTFYKLTDDVEHLENFVKRAVAPLNHPSDEKVV